MSKPAPRQDGIGELVYSLREEVRQLTMLAKELKATVDRIDARHLPLTKEAYDALTEWYDAALGKKRP